MRSEVASQSIGELSLKGDTASVRPRQRLGNRFLGLAKALYNYTPPLLQRLLVPLVYCYRAYQEIRPKVWIAESQKREDGLVMAVLCVAGTWDRSFVLGQVLGAGYDERCVGRAWLWHISNVLAEKGGHCCAVLVRVRPHFRRLLGSRKWLNIPSWLVGDIDLPLSREVLRRGNVKDDLRKIRKHSLRVEVTQSPRHLDDFYHNMYLPHITQRYRDGAVITSHHVMRKEFHKCELLLVKKQNEYVAGALIRYRDTGPSLWSIGIRDGNRQLVRDGAASALYYFLFDYLADKGFTKVGLGKSRAFLHDGVLMYKRKLGMRIIGTANGYFYLRVPKDTRASRAFLKANPLIFEREGQLYGAVFTDAGTGQFAEEDVERIDKGFFMDGLSQIQIVPFEGACSATIPSKLTERIAFCEVSELL